MRLLTAAVAAACLALAGQALAGAFPDGPGGPNIAVVNKSSLRSSTLAADLPVFQLYANQVCEAWHCNATLYLGAPKDPRDWLITVNDDTDVSSAVGYHGSSDAGVPFAFVSVRTAKTAGMSWTDVLTHELAEMLVDPASIAAMNTQNVCDPQTGGCRNATFYNLEVADPVQGESYTLGHVKVSDFVYRSWFTPGAPGPYDAGRHVSAPLMLAPNSYVAFYEDGAWQQRDSFPAFTPRAVKDRLELH